METGRCWRVARQICAACALVAGLVNQAEGDPIVLLAEGEDRDVTELQVLSWPSRAVSRA